jgi:undecaprenyl-diphosphatase
MTLFQSIIMGIIQGASEFLPISSSGHLVLAPYVFGWDIPPQEAFIFDVLVQVATLTAVIIYFWKDLLLILKSIFNGIIRRKLIYDFHSRLGWYLILATIPAGLAAIFFKDIFEKSFSNPKAAAIFLICTSIFLLIAEIFGSRTRTLETVSWLDALWIGFFQVFALFPGISRSGSTISGGMLRGFNRESSARFSFLMSVPVMSAAGVLAISDLLSLPNLLSNLPIYFAGFITAALVGYLAIRWFIVYLSKKSLYLFAGYCGAIGLIFLILLSL